VLIQAAVKAANLRVSQLETSAQIASQDGSTAVQEAQKLLQQVSQLQSALEKSKNHSCDLTAQAHMLCSRQNLENADAPLPFWHEFNTRQLGFCCAKSNLSCQLRTYDESHLAPHIHQTDKAVRETLLSTSKTLANLPN